MRFICLLYVIVLPAFPGWSQTLTEHHMTVDGRDRFYFLHLPTGLKSGKSYPLVMVFHGGGGTAKHIIGFCGFNILSEKEKFLVVYPNGYKKSWHDGRLAPSIDANHDNIDDVKFIRSVLSEVTTKFPVDTTRVFSTGISNGAMMSLHLAHSLSQKIRAIAPVCGNIAENMEKEFHPARPVSILVINGTDDRLVPYRGGPVISERARRGRVIGTDKMMTLWMSLLPAEGKETIEKMPDLDPEDGCNAERITYPASVNENIQLIRVNHGGHTWPGGEQYLPKMFVGKVCRDFKAEEIIWDFFKNIPPRKNL